MNQVEEIHTSREELIEYICRMVGIKAKPENTRGYFRRSDLIHLASWIRTKGGQDDESKPA